MSENVMKIFVFIGMIFFHILDDFHLQGILASMKQKSWWEDNYPYEIYKYDHDYIIALLIHGFEWMCMILIPVIAYHIIIGTESVDAVILLSIFIFQFLLHSFIDHLKTNRKSINLIVDQLLHLFQIMHIFFFLVINIY